MTWLHYWLWPDCNYLVTFLFMTWWMTWLHFSCAQKIALTLGCCNKKSSDLLPILRTYRTFLNSPRVNIVFCPPDWCRHRIIYIYSEDPGLTGVSENKVCGWVNGDERRRPLRPPRSPPRPRLVPSTNTSPSVSSTGCAQRCVPADAAADVWQLFL